MKKSMRVTAILLVLCMCSALAGCGKKDAGNAKNSKPVKVESDCDYFCPGAGFGFDLPENIIPVMMFAMGYPSERSKPNAWHFKRMPLKDFVTEL